MLFSILFACVEDPLIKKAAPSGQDSRDSLPSESAPDSQPDDTTDDSAPPEVDTVFVSHDREFRALYVATVWNIDWPGSSSDSAATQQADIISLLDLAQSTGFNAVVLQVRPEGDALYDSTIEPWSRWLTGTQGVDPGYDPLQIWVEEGHARGIEIHAWINPFRAKSGSESSSDLVAGSMAIDFPEYAYGYNGNVWMDPGSSEVRGRVVDVVMDLVGHYDLDGLHFDDYFYPYPDDTDFPDDATYNAYLNGGGTQNREDWRRSNTAVLVEDVALALAAYDPAIRFGIAPFGIWRPGYPDGITGFDAYEGLYADPLAWAEAGWLDYLAPQLYWETDNSGQEYGLLAPWWNDAIPDGMYLFPANNLSSYASSSTWTTEEYAEEIAICRGLSKTKGNLWYSASPLIDGASGLDDAFSQTYYATPALPPPVNALAQAVEPPPLLTLVDSTVLWNSSANRRAVTVYAESGDGWVLSKIVPAQAEKVALSSGRWVLASVGTGDVESLGVVVEIP